MDSFLEYMIKRKKDKITIFKCLLISFAGVTLSLFIFMIFLFLPPEAMQIFTLVIAGIFWGVYKIISNFDVEYEYSLTNGELDVDKIIHRKKRKRLLTVHCKTFIEFGKADKSKVKDPEISKVINAGANSKTHEDYYAIFYYNGQKYKLIFNPTAKMIDIFKIYAPRVVK